VAVKLIALPGVISSMNPLPQLLAVPPWMPKFNVSAAAGWVVVSIVVEFAGPAIDPEPRSGPVRPPWCQNQEPEQELFVHVRVRVTFLSPVAAWAAGTNATEAMRTMRIPKVRIPSLIGANRREMVEII